MKRTTVNLDDDLLGKAIKLLGPVDRSALLREGLNALIERESAKRLAKVGGSQPKTESGTASTARGRGSILVDTSVWLDHLRRGDTYLIKLLERSAVVMHPFVVGEISCSNLTDRATILELLQQMAGAMVAEFDKVLEHIDRHHLYGKGIGQVDVHLLASATIGETKLWTRDKRLSAIARELGCGLPDPTAH